MTENLRQALERLHALPPIPEIAREILALNLVTEEGEAALLKLIEKDPPISAKVIGLANSPLFRTSKRIASMHDAAALIGVRRVKMTALSFAMMASMLRHPPGVLNVHNIWQHSMAVTMWMHAISQHMPEERRPEDEEVFLAGLLHDIGFLVLDFIAPKLSDKFHVALAAETSHTAEELESQMLTMSHCEMGAELAQRWGLGDRVIAVLRYHHRPDDEHAAIGQPLVKMVNLAEKLIPTFFRQNTAESDIAPEEWQALGIDPADVPKLIEIAGQYTDATGHPLV
jgi:putative nucleotidyltransferase with HDIG domain